MNDGMFVTLGTRTYYVASELDILELCWFLRWAA